MPPTPKPGPYDTHRVLIIWVGVIYQSLIITFGLGLLHEDWQWRGHETSLRGLLFMAYKSNPALQILLRSEPPEDTMAVAAAAPPQARSDGE